MTPRSRDELRTARVPATAFAHTFGWALPFTLVTLVPVALLASAEVRPAHSPAGRGTVRPRGDSPGLGL